MSRNGKSKYIKSAKRRLNPELIEALVKAKYPSGAVTIPTKKKSNNFAQNLLQGETLFVSDSCAGVEGGGRFGGDDCVLCVRPSAEGFAPLGEDRCAIVYAR